MNNSPAAKLSLTETPHEAPSLMDLLITNLTGKIGCSESERATTLHLIL